MFGIIQFPVFVSSAIVLNLTPGADTIYILGRSMTGGRKAGVVSALGITAGAFIHTILAALGLSVILAKSATAFNVVKLLGAAYLIYMGVRTFLNKQPLLDDASQPGAPMGLRKVFFQGMLTNVLNPKVALFFLAFLPQFIDPANSFGPLPFLLLGCTFLCTSTLWCITLAFLSDAIRRLLARRAGVSKALNKITGVVFVALGLNLLRAKMEA